MKNHIIDDPSNDFFLAPLKEDHLPITMEWRNRDDVRVWFKTKNLVSISDHQNWFKNYLTKLDDQMYVATSRVTNEPLVQVALYNIDLLKKRAEFGRLICNPSHRGSGVTRAAINALLKYAREDLQLREIYLEVLSTNDRAIALYKSLGFVKQGSNGDSDLFIVLL